MAMLSYKDLTCQICLVTAEVNSFQDQHATAFLILFSIAVRPVNLLILESLRSMTSPI